jgi:phage FluMu protein Com
VENKLICIADFLTYEEGILLYNNLQEAGISALVKSSGPPSIPFGEGLFYQLLIEEEILEQAMEIAADFMQQVKEARKIISCPRCRSVAVFKVESLSFWQKIYYAGTQVFQCESCGKILSK